MSILQDQFNKLIKYPNGEAVGRKIAQLHELYRDPQFEFLRPSIERVTNIFGTIAEDRLYTSAN